MTPDEALALLRPRELEAVKLAWRGQREAAHRMGITVHTLKNHLDRAYHALGVGSLLDMYVLLGWLRIPD